MSLDEAIATGQLNKEEFQPNKNFMAQLRTFESMFTKPAGEGEGQLAEMSAQHMSAIMR